jgi:hypothetical protein
MTLLPLLYHMFKLLLLLLLLLPPLLLLLLLLQAAGIDGSIWQRQDHAAQLAGKPRACQHRHEAHRWDEA